MVVMALAAMLAAMALPAFSALMHGNSVAVTCGLIKNTLDLAQARAINDRKYVATVIDLGGTVSGLTDTQALRNCYVSNTYAFQGWVEGSDWVPLKEDAQMLIFDNGGEGTQPSFPTNGAAPGTSALQTITGVVGRATASRPGIVYAAYGNVVAPNQNFYIGVGEATLSNGNYIYKSQRSGSNATANVMAVTVNRFTGRALVSEIDENGRIK